MALDEEADFVLVRMRARACGVCMFVYKSLFFFLFLMKANERE